MKFLPSGPAGGAPSGSMGGVVASHNRSGYYFRTRTIPTNPNSIRQQAVRTNFGTLVQQWTSGITAAQRALWTDYANNTPVLDALGNQILLTGQNQFIRSNSVRLQIGQAIIAAAPTTYNTGSPVTRVDQESEAINNTLGVNLAEDAYDTSLVIAGGASADGDAVLYIGSTLNPTRTFYKGPYQYATTVAVTADDTTESVTTSFASAFNANGNPVDGQTRAVRVRIMYDDGRLSQPYDAILPVVAATS